MRVYTGKDIRNVAVVGHSHSGKTTLVAALLKAAKDCGQTSLAACCFCLLSFLAIMENSNQKQL